MKVKNRRGFTLIEMIIVTMLTVLTISVVSSIFFVGNRIFSDADIKSTFQNEEQNIQEELSKRNMQGTGINEIITDSKSIAGSELDEWFKEEKLTSVKEISINYVNAEKQNNKYEYKNKAYIFKLIHTGDFMDEGKKVNVYKFVMTDEDGSIKKTLSENVIDFSIKPNGVDSLLFNIVLGKHAFKENTKYRIEFEISFRNKNSIL